MSWIIQSLLNEREHIREQNDIDSDEFNDLLIIEKAIKELTLDGMLSKDDLQTLEVSDEDRSLTLSMNRNEKATYYKKYSVICERIAYYLGGYFTDEGYLNYMQRKHKLNENQVESLRTYIKSKFRFQIIRKPIKS